MISKKVFSIMLVAMIILSSFSLVFATEPTKPTEPTNPVFEDFPYYVKLAKYNSGGTSYDMYYYCSNEYIYTKRDGLVYRDYTVFDSDKNFVRVHSLSIVNEVNFLTHSSYALIGANHNIYSEYFKYNIFPLALPDVINITQNGTNSVYNNKNLFFNSEILTDIV